MTAPIDTTRLLDKLVPETDGPSPVVLRTMTVATINTDGTLDLTDGAGVTVPGVPRLASAVVSVGYRVQVLTGRGMALVIGPANIGSQSWTPALTATTTSPTLGTGGVTGWVWSRKGIVTASARFSWGASGSTPGSGDFRISLPVTASPLLNGDGALGNGHPIGIATLRNGANGPVSTGGTVQLVSPTTALILAPGGGAVGGTNPWSWAANSQINIMFSYPAA